MMLYPGELPEATFVLRLHVAQIIVSEFAVVGEYGLLTMSFGGAFDSL